MDIALCIDELVPAAKFSGSLTSNEREAFDNLGWSDDRSKPSWGDVLTKWDEIENRPAPVKVRDVTAEDVARELAAIKPEHEALKAIVPGVVKQTKKLNEQQSQDRETIDLLRQAVPSVLAIGRQTKEKFDDLRDQVDPYAPPSVPQAEPDVLPPDDDDDLPSMFSNEKG